MVLASPARPAASWRWYLALSEANSWGLSEGPAEVVIAGDSISSEFRDAADSSRIHARLRGTVHGDSVRVMVTLLGVDAEPFPAKGELQRLCSLGHGRELIMLIAEGGALGITRDVPCSDSGNR
jgi:hypothetical protein